jgi:hypothetical protein
MEVEVSQIKVISCETRRKLAEEFAIAARMYADTVALLTRGGTTPGEKYDQLRRAAEEARQRAETARILFEEHVDLHRCSA